jgi:hypothetical protein
MSTSICINIHQLKPFSTVTIINQLLSTRIYYSTSINTNHPPPVSPSLEQNYGSIIGSKGDGADPSSSSQVRERRPSFSSKDREAQIANGDGSPGFLIKNENLVDGGLIMDISKRPLGDETTDMDASVGTKLWFILSKYPGTTFALCWSCMVLNFSMYGGIYSFSQIFSGNTKGPSGTSRLKALKALIFAK